MNLERRDHLRILLQDKSYASLGSNYARVGKIKNISRGGLALEYIAGEPGSWHSSRVDIFMLGHGIHICDVPCEIIYDIEIQGPHIHRKYGKILTVARCGVKFGELPESDLTELKLFIENQKRIRQIRNQPADTLKTIPKEGEGDRNQFLIPGNCISGQQHLDGLTSCSCFNSRPNKFEETRVAKTMELEEMKYVHPTHS